LKTYTYFIPFYIITYDGKLKMRYARECENMITMIVHLNGREMEELGTIRHEGLVGYLFKNDPSPLVRGTRLERKTNEHPTRPKLKAAWKSCLNFLQSQETEIKRRTPYPNGLQETLGIHQLGRATHFGGPATFPLVLRRSSNFGSTKECMQTPKKHK